MNDLNAMDKSMDWITDCFFNEITEMRKSMATDEILNSAAKRLLHLSSYEDKRAVLTFMAQFRALLGYEEIENEIAEEEKDGAGDPVE